MTGKDVLPEKDLLEKATAVKRFENSPLGEELKTQTDIAKKRYQRNDKAFISNKDNKYLNESVINKENRDLKNYKGNLTFHRLSFYSYSDDKKFDSLSFNSKYSYLSNFSDYLEKLIKIKPINLGQVKEKEKLENTASELYNKRFENYCNESKKKKLSLIKNSSLET